MKLRYPLATAATLATAAMTAVALAQQSPRLAAVYPAGAAAGQSVDVALRGGNLVNPKGLIVVGAPGVSAKLAGGSSAVDESVKPVFSARCTTCHEARSPANRTLSPEQWASTVDRMINQRGADINKADRDRIVGYLQALAKAGQLRATITVAPDAAPGMREIRLVTDRGVSSAWSFEVGNVPEIESKAASSPDAAQAISLPTLINGAMTTAGGRDFFRFSAKKGERLAFNLKAFRLNEASQSFFNPALYLYDASGHELAKSFGRFDLDPLIDWTAPESGEYILLVRDLLWKGNPASIYRLSAGAISYDTALSPLVIRPGASVSAVMTSSMAPGGMGSIAVRAPLDISGVMNVATPMGDAPLLVRDLPDGGGPVSSVDLATAVNLPAIFTGKLERDGQIDRFKVRALGNSSLELYARRLGSPLRAKVIVKNSKGEIIQNRAGDNGADVRIGNAFPQPGEYTVEITDTGGGGGFYAWEASGGGNADFALTATPDGVNVSPGGTAAIVVRAIRRDSIPGPIEVSMTNLPPGVRAEPAIIPPDDDKAILLLTVDSRAATGGASVRIEGKTTLKDGRVLSRRAQPIELYRTPNNNLRSQTRDSAFAGITSEEPPFALTLAGIDSLTLSPGQSANVTVKVLRNNGFRGDVQIVPLGLPPGISAPGAVNVPANRDTVEITLRAGNDARFLTQRPSPELPPMRFVFAGTTGGNNADAPYLCTLPISISGPRTVIDVRSR